MCALDQSWGRSDRSKSIRENGGGSGEGRAGELGLTRGLLKDKLDARHLNNNGIVQ